MNKLIQELRRLYFLPEPSSSAPFDQSVAQALAGNGHAAFDLLAPEGRVRAMMVGFERAADWERVAALYQGLQEDLELPLPAISVSVRSGYQLWLSLADDVSFAEARQFLEALDRKYLTDIPAASRRLLPAAEEKQATLAPALDEASGKWSAFIDPSMGAMFVAEPGLDMAPNMERQADMLAGLASIKLTDFHRALAILSGAAADSGLSEGGLYPPAPEPGRARSTLTVDNNFTDPRAFLLAVMNDPAATTGQRIKAAKALLPYCKPAAGE